MAKSQNADSTTTRRARRYSLDRMQREFATDNILPVYIEQTQKNVTALRRLADDGGNDFMSKDIATQMANQFDANLTKAHGILKQLSEGTLSGSDDDSSDS